MSLPFRVRRAEWIAGAFVLLAVIGLVGSLVLLSRARGTFEPTVSYHVTLADGYGIATGSRVEMLGIEIGTIESLQITDDNKVAARLEIRERFAGRLRADSVARIKASLDLQGVLGGVGLSVSPGSPGADPLAPGDTIAVAEPKTVADLLPQVEGDPLMEDIEALIHNARNMSDQVADPNAPLQQALTQTIALLTALQDKKGTVGRVLADDGQMYDRLVTTLDSVETSLARLDRVLSRSGKLVGKADGLMTQGDELLVHADKMVGTSDRVMGKLDPVIGNTDTAMKDLDDAVLRFAETTAELQKVLQALGPVVEDMDKMVENMDEVAEAAKKVWPLRRHTRRRRGK